MFYVTSDYIVSLGIRLTGAHQQRYFTSLLFYVVSTTSLSLTSETTIKIDDKERRTAVRIIRCQSQNKIQMEHLWLRGFGLSKTNVIIIIIKYEWS